MGQIVKQRKEWDAAGLNAPTWRRYWSTQISSTSVYSKSWMIDAGLRALHLATSATSDAVDSFDKMRLWIGSTYTYTK